MLKLGFIGAGRTGTALAVRLREKGYPVVVAASRTKSSADKLAAAVAGCRPYDSKQEVADAAELVFVTTTDDVIPQIIDEVRWNVGQSVVHCSGADSLNILEKAKSEGARVGAFHPLQIFASVTHAIDNLPGSIFALEAEGPLLEVLKGMAESLGGHWIVLAPGDKVLYHAAAVIACNYAVTHQHVPPGTESTVGLSQTKISIDNNSIDTIIGAIQKVFIVFAEFIIHYHKASPHYRVVKSVYQ